MISEKIINKILASFSFPVVEALELYVDERISVIHKLMESTTDLQDLGRLQGAITELKKVKELRNTVKAIYDREVSNGRRETA